MKSIKSIFQIVIIGVCFSVTGCSIGSPPVTDADNDQVITLGDSIFDLSGEIQESLETYAGETFRRYTQNGAELFGGVLSMSVYEQYEMAKSNNPDIDIIVMNGGGNDILIPAILLDPYNCMTQWYQFGRLSTRCKNFIDDLYVEGVNVLNEMYVDGVENVIYLGYYHTKNGLFHVDSLEEAVDYGDETLARACRNTIVNCEFVDPRSSINDSDIIFDGIHPASSGSQKLADLIWLELEPLL
jgi:lysophospholipase L1-like esterase